MKNKSIEHTRAQFVHNTIRVTLAFLTAWGVSGFTGCTDDESSEHTSIRKINVFDLDSSTISPTCTIEAGTKFIIEPRRSVSLGSQEITVARIKSDICYGDAFVSPWPAPNLP